jgi:hypothetical protein
MKMGKEWLMHWQPMVAPNPRPFITRKGYNFAGSENACPGRARGLTPRLVQRAMIASHAHQTQI